MSVHGGSIKGGGGRSGWDYQWLYEYVDYKPIGRGLGIHTCVDIHVRIHAHTRGHTHT